MEKKQENNKIVSSGETVSNLAFRKPKEKFPLQLNTSKKKKGERNIQLKINLANTK